MVVDTADPSTNTSPIKRVSRPSSSRHTKTLGRAFSNRLLHTRGLLGKRVALLSTEDAPINTSWVT